MEWKSVLAAAIHTPDRDIGPLEGAEAGIWSLGSNHKARAAVDCGDMDRGDVREEIMVDNACAGKQSSHRIKVILLSHA